MRSGSVCETPSASSPSPCTAGHWYHNVGSGILLQDLFPIIYLCLSVCSLGSSLAFSDGGSSFLAMSVVFHYFLFSFESH